MRECKCCKEVVSKSINVCPICQHLEFREISSKAPLDTDEDNNVPEDNTGNFPW